MKKAILLLTLSLLLLWMVPLSVMASDVLSDEVLSLLYTCKDESINDTCLTITQEEVEILMKMAVTEDYTDAESQAWVMMVILNRVESPDFPDTISEVVSQKNQFASYGSKRYRDAVPDVNSHLALAMVESGIITVDALYFEANYCKDSWQSRNLEYVGNIGKSKFYK